MAARTRMRGFAFGIVMTAQPPSLTPRESIGVPLVTALIPAYNAQVYLAACLASVHAQSGAFQLEVLVVDDGSRDATADVARQHPGVQCITQPNRGPSAARNTGFAAAKGDFIAFLDADDLWPEGKLEAQLQVLQQHPTAALVFGDCRQFGVAGPRPLTEFAVNGLGTQAWGGGGLVPDAYARLLENNFITTGSVVVRRAALDEAGGFAEDLRLAEDLDLWLRIARRHPIAWCPQECLWRRRHDTNISLDARAVGTAYLEVLRRHASDWRPGEARALGVDASRLAAMEELHLAELAMAQGHAGDTRRHLWRSLKSYPRPASAWRATKTLMKLGARRLGLLT